MIDNDYREVDTDEKNVSDVEETKEGTPVETGEVVTDDPTEDNEKTDDFDEFCAMCRRPASKAGKLIHVAPNMAICQDCMQKTFDTMGRCWNPGSGRYQYRRYAVKWKDAEYPVCKHVRSAIWATSRK